MTARASTPADETARQIAKAAKLAAAHGVEITIQDGGRVYTISPARQGAPVDPLETVSMKR